MNSPLSSEAARRRTFAVIAHPDAGKSTLTEALALHAHVIAEAGAVHGKAGRKATVSDWTAAFPSPHQRCSLSTPRKAIKANRT